MCVQQIITWVDLLILEVHPLTFGSIVYGDWILQLAITTLKQAGRPAFLLFNCSWNCLQYYLFTLRLCWDTPTVRCVLIYNFVATRVKLGRYLSVWTLWMAGGNTIYILYISSALAWILRDLTYKPPILPFRLLMSSSQDWHSSRFSEKLLELAAQSAKLNSGAETLKGLTVDNWCGIYIFISSSTSSPP